MEQARQELGLEAPVERRRTVDRLDRFEVERLIAAAYRHASVGGRVAAEQKITLGSQHTFEVGPKVDYACRIPH